MRKYLIVPTLMLMTLVTTSSSAFAREENSTTEQQAKVAVEKQKREEKKKEQVERLWSKMEYRLDILIHNQEKLANRISNRLTSLKDDGKDVGVLETKLTNAKVLVTQSQEALAAGDAAVALVLKNNDSKTALSEIKEINKDILEKIKSSHASLVEVIKGVNSAKSQ